jgi:Ca2+-transporting ATPase
VNLQQKPTDIATPRTEQIVAGAEPRKLAIAPHREPAPAVVAELGSDGTRGLGHAEAQRRLQEYGPNQLKSAPETPWWKRLLEQFQNFLVIILLVATVISMVEWLLQDPRETALP